jgi:hypothetical protein
VSKEDFKFLKAIKPCKTKYHGKKLIIYFRFKILSAIRSKV